MSNCNHFLFNLRIDLYHWEQDIVEEIPYQLFFFLSFFFKKRKALTEVEVEINRGERSHKSFINKQSVHSAVVASKA